MPTSGTARIVLGVSGGIAAYKACDLVRLLVKAGHDVVLFRARTADEQIRFYVESQSANRKAGKVTWQFELVLRAMEAKLKAFDSGLAPSWPARLTNNAKPSCKTQTIKNVC